MGRELGQPMPDRFSPSFSLQDLCEVGLVSSLQVTEGW